MELEINKCLNEFNREFYSNNVASELNVKLFSSETNDNIWSNNFIDGNENVTICAGNDYPNVYSFSHEMLHLYLFANQFSSHGSHINCYESLRCHIVNPIKLANEITNCTAHYKMLPIFTKELNHGKHFFFANWKRLVNDPDIAILKAEYEYTCSSQCVHFTNFIKYFFYTRYHFNNALAKEYNNYQDKLKEIDKALFEILANSCTLWEKEITNYNNIKFTNSLYPELNKYLK